MNTLPELFGATYLINLKGRTDRLRSSKKQFSRVGWQFNTNQVRIFPAFRFAEPAGFLNAATRGCFHSHLECLRLSQADGCRSVLIMEDDIALTSSLPRLTPAIQSQLASQAWDFVYFGHYGTGDIPTADRNTNECQMRFDVWTSNLSGGHFYAVSGRILPRLISYLNNVANGYLGDLTNRPMPVDGAHNIFRRNNSDVRCLIANPILGWQRASQSDISPHALDKLAFLRPVTRALRSVKGIWGHRKS
jgi:glycosyl transferase, family 25